MSSTMQPPTIYRASLPTWKIIKCPSDPQIEGRLVEARTLSEAKGVLKSEAGLVNTKEVVLHKM
jgi:hypothetical protein